MAALFFVALPPSCGSKEDVSLDVYAADLSLAKKPTPFGAKLEGAVTVVFNLGHYSGAPVQVESVKVSLYRGDRQVLSRVRAVPGPDAPLLPATLRPGEQRRISFALTLEQLLPEEVTELCAGPISAAGTVQQVGKADPIRIGAQAISPAGCP